KISLYDSLLRPTTEMLGIISIALSILVGAYLVLNQQTHIFGIWMCSRPLKPGSLLLFYTLLAGASDPARKMSEVINILVRGGTACENLMKAFDEKPQIVAHHPQVAAPTISKSIVFDQVQFTYRGKHPAVAEVSFAVPARQAIAIVGANGSGKSTLINLLLRFYDPQRGRILIDDIDIRHVSPRNLRRQFAWVTQDSVLFKGTIWDNIAYGKFSASREEIERAARLALVWDFALSLPQGMDSPVGDQGRLLSAGQRQRVAWARAILANPSVLILDEATSQIDGKTENLLHEGLEPFIRERTTLIITHRHSSLRWVDRVLVMEQGRLVEDLSRTEASHQSREFQHLFYKSA
ncbi:MAG TPA: ABC transporter ATP-binding protein, partial [Pirellulaceae bacterium]|nr:ABC transporter ATP-binding protein [Pirellulaceae bacterium]